MYARLDPSPQKEISLQFWVSFLDKSAIYSIATTAITALVLMGMSSLAFFIHPYHYNDTNVTFYHQIVAVCIYLVIWAVLNSVICGSLIYYKYSRLHVPDFQAGQFVLFWRSLGYFVLGARILVFIVQMRTLGSVRGRPGLNVPTVEAIDHNVWSPEYAAATLLLNVFQSLMMSMQPFPWPWALLLCLIQVVEECVVLYLLQDQWTSVPSTTLLQVYLFAGASFASIPFAAGKYIHFNLEAFKLSVQHEQDAQQKRRFVELLCSDIRLPLQYIGNAVATLPQEHLTPSLKWEFNRMVRNYRSVNSLVECVFLLMKIDENRFQVGPAHKLLDVGKLFYKRIITNQQLHLDTLFTTCFGIDIRTPTVIEIPETGLIKLLENIVNIANINIAAHFHAVDSLAKLASLDQQRAGSLTITCLNITDSPTKRTRDYMKEFPPVKAQQLSCLKICARSHCPLTAQVQTSFDSNSCHMVAIRAVTHLMFGTFAVQVVNGLEQIEIELPCYQWIQKSQAGDEEFVPLQQHASINSLWDPSFDPLIGGHTRGKDAIRLVAVLEEEGIEACVMAMLDKAPHLACEFTGLVELLDNISMNSQQQGTSERDEKRDSSFGGYNDAVVIIASKLASCELIRRHGFPGKLVICTASLPYLESQVVSFTCDLALPIPCLPADTQALLAFIYRGIDKPIVHPLQSRESSLRNDLVQTSKIITTQLQLQQRSFWNTLSARSLYETLLAVKYFLFGDFLCNNDDQGDGLLTTKHLEYERYSVFGLHLFEIGIEKSFFIWRSINPVDTLAFELGQRVSLLLQIFLQLAYDVIKAPRSSWLTAFGYLTILVLIFAREYVFRVISLVKLSISPENTYYALWKMGIIVGYFVILSDILGFYRAFEAQRNAGLINSVGELIDGLYADVTGSQMIVALAFVLILSSQWTIYFPWPTSLLLASIIIARQCFVVAALRPFIDRSLELLLFTFFIHYGVILIISLYHTETLQRTHFRAYRKMAHSDRFMTHIHETFIKDVSKPLATLSADKATMIRVFEASIRSYSFVMNREQLRNWSLCKFGYLVIEGVVCQLRFRHQMAISSCLPVLDSKKPDDGTFGWRFIPVVLANEVTLLASSIQALVFSDRYDVNITYQIDHRIAYIRTDVKILRTVLGNALSTAYRNIQRKLQITSNHRGQSIHHICIRITQWQSIENTNALNQKSPSSPSIKRNLKRLKFVDPRLLVIEVLDTGTMETNPHAPHPQQSRDRDILSQSHSLAVSWKTCKDIVLQAGASMCPQLAAQSFYDVQPLCHPFSPYACRQRFTLPYKLDSATMIFARDPFISGLHAKETHVAIHFDKFLLNYDKWLSGQPQQAHAVSNGNPSVAWARLTNILPSESNSASTESPLMVLIYERPPRYRGVIGANAPYFHCLRAFERQNWRYQVIFDVSTPESLELLKQASCVVIDNCVYNNRNDPSSADVNHHDPSHHVLEPHVNLATYLRVMGYVMITVGMFSEFDSNLSKTASMKANYDAVLVEPILPDAIDQLVSLLRDRLLSLLLNLQLHSNKSISLD